MRRSDFSASISSGNSWLRTLILSDDSAGILPGFSNAADSSCTHSKHSFVKSTGVGVLAAECCCGCNWASCAGESLGGVSILAEGSVLGGGSFAVVCLVVSFADASSQAGWI